MRFNNPTHFKNQPTWVNKAPSQLALYQSAPNPRVQFLNEGSQGCQTTVQLHSGSPFSTVVGYDYNTVTLPSEVSWISGALQTAWPTKARQGYFRQLDNYVTGLYTPSGPSGLQTALINSATVGDEYNLMYSEAQGNFTVPEGSASDFGIPGATQAYRDACEAARNAQAPTKKIIYEWGYIGGGGDSYFLYPQRMQDRIGFLGRLPFDGLLIYACNVGDQTGTSDITYRTFNAHAYSYSDVKSVFAPFYGMNWGNLQHNFVRIDGFTFGGNSGLSMPALDWFDDTSCGVIATSLGNIAQVCQEVGFKGICIDTEMFDTGGGYYPSQPNHGSHTQAAYITKCVARGTQFMQAMMAKFPGIVVLLMIPPGWSDATFDPTDATKGDLIGPLSAGFVQATL